MAATDLLYPFATQDGKNIPLDIINPEGLIVQSFASDADSLVGPIANLEVAVFIASKACFVSFGAALPDPLVNGVEYSDTLLVPSGVTITVQCPGTSFYVRGTSEPGTLYVQKIKRWLGLGIPKQYTRK